MANPIGLNGTHSRQERYADMIVQLFRKELVVRNEFSRDYEGDPVAGAVQVPVRNLDVEIGDYNVATGGALTQSATTFTPILITKNRYVNEIIDGYEAAAVPDNIVAQRLESAAYVIGTELEKNAINELVDNGTASENTDEITKANAYTSIKDDIIKLKSQGVSINDIIVVVGANTESMLLEDTIFANSAGALGSELIRNGVIGRIVGANVKSSYNLPDDVDYIVFARPWAQAIDEWRVDPTIENLTNEFIGASALKGRFIYEDKLTNPLACIVKTTEEI